jgi:AcrR family transcriptional regulator
MKTTPGTDARVRKTRRRLRDALVTLIHQKSYDAIVVSDILERADVGRSAFYAHFANKHALLESGIDHVLHASPARQPPTNWGPFSKVVWFSLPFFEYVGQCRHTTPLETSRRGRMVLHAHLRELLADRIGRDIRAIAVSLKKGAPGIPPELLADHVVGTFIIVLNWWVDTESPLSPHEIDDVFLTLVGPALSAAARE